MALTLAQVAYACPLSCGLILAYSTCMSVQVNLPDDLAERIDQVASDRTAFVTQAVKRLLRDAEPKREDNEVARLNELADELNREAEDVLEYQVIS